MDCLNRFEIQQYLDGEVSNEAQAAFTIHIQNCQPCKSLFNSAKQESREINEFISLTQINQDRINVPAFKAVKGNRIHKKWITYSSIAAGILLIIFVYQYKMMTEARNERFIKAQMEAERYIYESDPNKLWNEKQSIIIVIDAEGNLIYLNN
jgi:predicted anti-sigma-YlaC factor YlaD